jgi:hypothetical protein
MTQMPQNIIPIGFRSTFREFIHVAVPTRVSQAMDGEGNNFEVECKHLRILALALAVQWGQEKTLIPGIQLG